MKKLSLFIGTVLCAFALVGCADPSIGTGSGTGTGTAGGNSNNNTNPQTYEMVFTGEAYKGADSPLFTLLDSTNLSKVGTIQVKDKKAVISMGDSIVPFELAQGPIPSEYKEILTIEGYTPEEMTNLYAFSLNEGTVATNVPFTLDFDNLKATITGADFIMLPDIEVGRQGGYDLWYKGGLYFVQPEEEGGGQGNVDTDVIDQGAFNIMSKLGELKYTHNSINDVNAKLFRYSEMKQSFLEKITGEPNCLYYNNYENYVINNDYNCIELIIRKDGNNNIYYEMRFFKKGVDLNAYRTGYELHFNSTNDFFNFIASIN